MSLWLPFIFQSITSALGLQAEEPKQVLPALKLIVPDDPPSNQKSLPRGAIARFGEPINRRLMSHNSIFSPDGRMIAIEGETFVELRDAKDGSLIREIPFPGLPNSLAFSSDGKQLAIGGTGEICVYATADGNECARLKLHKSDVTALSFNRDGTRLVAGTADAWVSLWDVTTRTLLKEAEFDSGAPILHLCFSRNDTRIGIGSANGLARVWNAATLKNACSLEPRRGGVNAMAFLPSGKLVVAVAQFGACLYELEAGDVVGFLDETDGLAAVSPDGKFLAAVRADPNIDTAIRVFDLATEKLFATMRGHRGGVTRLDFHPDGKTLHTMGRDGIPRIWDVASGKEIGRASGHQGEVTGIAFRNGGKEVVSASQDGTVRFWEVAKGREKKRFVGGDETFLALDCSRDEKTLALLSARTLGSSTQLAQPIEVPRYRFVDPVSGKTQIDGKLTELRASRYAISADRRFVECADAGPPIRIQVPGNQHIHQTRDDFFDCCIAADGALLVGVDSTLSFGERRIRCVDLPAERIRFEQSVLASYAIKPAISPTALIAVIPGMYRHESQIRKTEPIAAFCARDILAATSSAEPIETDYQLQIWNLVSGNPIKVHVSETYFPGFVHFSPDGRLFSVADRDGVVVYETHTGSVYRRFTGEAGFVCCMAFSRDNRFLVTGSDDSSILVWELETPSSVPGVNLEESDWVRCWQDLADVQPMKARRAMWHFINRSEAGLRLLEAHLDIARDADLRRVPELLKELDADRFADRQRAERELARIGLAVRPALERAKAESASLETRQSAERLLRAIGHNENAQSDSRLRRAIRVVEILQRFDSTKSRELLQQLREHGCYDLLRREAK